MDALLQFRQDPKCQAKSFLRAYRVEYNDLITGDHAADLLAHALLLFTDYQRHVDMLDLQFEIDALKTITTPFVMQDFGKPIPISGDGPHLLTAKDGSQAYCGGRGKCKWCDKEAK